MLHQIEEPCSLGAHAGVIVPPSWIIKVRKPQVKARASPPVNKVHQLSFSDTNPKWLDWSKFEGGSVKRFVSVLLDMMGLFDWSVWGRLVLPPTHSNTEKRPLQTRYMLHYTSNQRHNKRGDSELTVELCPRPRAPWRTPLAGKRGHLSNEGRARKDWTWVISSGCFIHIQRGFLTRRNKCVYVIDLPPKMKRNVW